MTEHLNKTQRNSWT